MSCLRQRGMTAGGGTASGPVTGAGGGSMSRGVVDSMLVSGYHLRKLTARQQRPDPSIYSL